jgi:hypothetical protein
MIRRPEGSVDRETRNQQIARSILGLGVVAAGFSIAQALLATKKTRVIRPIFSFVIIPLAAILLVSCLLTFFKKRLNRFQREDAE